MILRDALLLQKTSSLARDTFKGVSLRHGDNFFNHLRRIVDRAIINEWPDYIAAACWLSDINDLDYDHRLALVDETYGFNQELSKTLATLIHNPEMSLNSHMTKIAMSPDARAVMWLKILDILQYNHDFQTASQLSDWVIRMYPKEYASKS